MNATNPAPRRKRQSSLEKAGGPIGNDADAKPLPKNTQDVLDNLEKASDVISQGQPAASNEPPAQAAPEQPAAPAAETKPDTQQQPAQQPPETPEEPPQLTLQEILAIRKANAKEHTLQRNYRMPVSLLADMDTLQALGYEFSAMVVAGTRAHVAELKKKHGLK
jgi:hypothetical protein